MNILSPKIDAVIILNMKEKWVPILLGKVRVSHLHKENGGALGIVNNQPGYLLGPNPLF